MEENKEIVLVVDDDDNIRTILKRSLERHGFTVIEAGNGEAALEVARQNEIDVAILDIKMPGLSGLDVLKELSVFRPDIGVIMATAVDDRQTAVDTIKMGAYDYITKPFNSDDVVQIVRKAVQKRAQKINDRKRDSEIRDKLSEQAQQLTSQFRELMGALMREQQLLAGGNNSRLPPELQKPMSSVDEFKDALLRILQRQQIE